MNETSNLPFVLQIGPGTKSIKNLPDQGLHINIILQNEHLCKEKDLFTLISAPIVKKPTQTEIVNIPKIQLSGLAELSVAPILMSEYSIEKCLVRLI